MPNFKVINRISGEVQDSLETAKSLIMSLDDGVDGEMVIARYSDGNDVKSIIGICHIKASKCEWTIVENKLGATYDETTKTLKLGL